MKVSRSTVYRWIERGDVPTFQLGGKTRISLSAVRSQLPAVHEAMLDELAEVCDPSKKEPDLKVFLSQSVANCHASP